MIKFIFWFETQQTVTIVPLKFWAALFGFVKANDTEPLKSVKVYKCI